MWTRNPPLKPSVNGGMTSFCVSHYNILTCSYIFLPYRLQKSDNKVKTFHLSKINSISCTFTPSTMRKINKSIRNAVYFALIFWNNLLWQFLVTFCSGILLSQYLSGIILNQIALALLGFECPYHLWLSTQLKLHSFSSKMTIRRSAQPPKILGQKAISNH